MAEPTRNTVKAKQLLLREAGASLKVDGIQGARTMAAIKDYPALKGSFDQIEQMFGEAAKLVKQSNVWVPVQEIDALVRKAAQYVPFSTAQIKFIIDLEAQKKRFDGVVHYQADYDIGGARGIGQFYPKAWMEAKGQALKAGYTLKPFELGWADPEQSVMATAFYMVAAWENANLQLRKSGFKILISPSVEVIYALYNQGPGFALKTARLGRRPDLIAESKQSPQAIMIATKASKEILQAVA